MRNYPSVHVHPQSLDSGSTPEAFAEREIELGTGVLVCTDHGSMGACRKVYDLARAKGLTPILGLEAYFRDDDCPILLANNIPKLHPRKKNTRDKDAVDETKPKDFSHFLKYAHLTLTFLDQEAYETGVRLLSKASLNRLERHGSEAKPLFNWADLEELGSKNVIMSTGCLVGIVQRFLVDHNNASIARQYYDRLRSIAKPGNFIVEVFPHDCSKNWVNGVFITLAGGDGHQKLKYYDGKTLRTNIGEIKAGDLAAQFAKEEERRRREGRTDRLKEEHAELLGVKDYHAWTELPSPRIVSVEHISDFLPNECRPWAPDGDVQKGCNRFMLALAKEHGDLVVIGDDSHYAHKGEKIVQDVRLLNRDDNGYGDSSKAHSWRFYGHYHRQSSEESFEHFNRTLGTDLKTFEGWVDNAYAWADRFKGFSLDYKPSLPTSFYPEDTLQHTMSLIRKHGRMDWKNPQYVERLKQELGLLHKNGVLDLLPYFFIDEEVCSLYEKNGLLTGPGRGSAAGLLLTYLLGITHVDPLEFDLSLDRFLTLDRIRSGKLPDIDQDLPHRDLLVDPKDPSKGWLAERFGDHVAQVSVDTTLKLRNAAKDVTRMIHGRVPPEVEALTKKFARAPQGVTDTDFVFGYDAGGEPVLGSIYTDKALQEFIKLYPKEWEIVKLCLGLARQKGRHACAYVVANKPISHFIPVQLVSGVPVTQYTAPSVEAVGGIKMDFLVINSLKDISDAIQLIQQRSGVEIPESVVIDGKRVPRIRVIPHNGRLLDVWKLWVSPHADEVFLDVAEGRTETCFQFNTPGAVQWLKHFDFVKEQAPGVGKIVKAIDSIEAMAAFTALDRPGPLDAFVTKGGTGIQHARIADRVSEAVQDQQGGIYGPRQNSEGESKKPRGEQHNMLVEYARRARGAARSPDVLPVFDELFPETYGVMVYQEQLQRLYQRVTGCTGAEAEEFRSNVAKKKMEKVLKAHPKFIEAATTHLGSVEQAQAVWDFIVSWGQYGFNKSHSVCYSVIGYACAYLKHHFPLEWWTAVLRNAEKNEINEKFWKYAGHLIDLPDVKMSGDGFEIQNERIRAPLSLLHGIGEGAHKQLQDNKPYTDIDDFCRKIQLHRERGAKVSIEKAEKTIKVKRMGANGKPLRVDGKYVYDEHQEMVEVEKKRLGSSALNRKVIYTLIVSGAMDSLFPPGTSVLEQLELYEEALAKATGKKLEKVDRRYTSLHQIQRYQMRKKVLPAYSDRLLPMFVEREIEGVVSDGRRICLRHENPDCDWAPFVTPERFASLGNLSPWPDRQRVTVAAAAYVEGARKFQFQGTKEAIDFTFDWDGTQVSAVKWPEKNGKLLKRFKDTDYKGAVVAVLLSKYREDKPFAVDDIVVIEPPLGILQEPEESK